MSSVIFEDQGIEDCLPFVGLTVGAVKQRLRGILNIPYFADAIVNGEIVPVAHLLHGGDRLRFQKRYGVKGGDDRPSEEREAEGLIRAYDLGEIISAVKRRNLPRDESLDLVAVMIGQWAERNFGPADHHARRVLGETVRQLPTVEARLGVASQKDPQSSTTVSLGERSRQLRLRVIESDNVVVIGDEHHVMDERYVAIIACLLDAKGAWLSGSEMSQRKKCLDLEDRPDRLIGKLKIEYPKIGKHIESVRGRGFRLNLT